MSSKNRPRRSMLYMPASNPRAIEKSKLLPADVLIFDLEDAVSPDNKIIARGAAKNAVNSSDYGGRELLVRVNGLDTKWAEQDIKEIATSDADGIVVPKVSSIDDIIFIESILNDSGANEDFSIWAMMETPEGVLTANTIAKASRRLMGFCVGTADLSKELGCAHPADRSPMIMSLQMIILAGRANELFVIDGVHMDLNDDEGYVKSCIQGKDLGFDGKTLIHPNQIKLANDIFSPSDDEIILSERIIDAHAKALAKGSGVITLDGKLIEVLHVEQAKNLLKKAASIRLLENEF